MITDCHTHTHNSFDAENDTVRERCERAIELGIAAMAVTDHCEANRFYPAERYGITVPAEHDVYNYRQFYESSVAEVTAAKEEYRDRLELVCGIELGQGTADDGAADIICGDKRVDFIIGSMHELPGREDFFFLDYSKLDVDELMEENFNEIYKLCRQNKFDVLGHLTYSLRYIEGEQHIKVDIDKYKDIIAEIFKEIIKNGKGIEINTSGLRQAYGRTFPSGEYVKLYRELGGKIITLGSDCHSTADLGAGIAQGIEIAQAAGFDRAAYYINHEPRFIEF
ncbi:MAG: histidinol-phosphatase HisJ family protein [Porcipelethomonas sp.]